MTWVASIVGGFSNSSKVGMSANAFTSTRSSATPRKGRASSPQNQQKNFFFVIIGKIQSSKFYTKYKNKDYF